MKVDHQIYYDANTVCSKKRMKDCEPKETINVNNYIPKIVNIKNQDVRILQNILAKAISSWNL